MLKTCKLCGKKLSKETILLGGTFHRRCPIKKEPPKKEEPVEKEVERKRKDISPKTEEKATGMTRSKQPEAETENTCPFKHTFGKDCEEFDECNDCKLWDKCFDEKEK